jgi:uncharacterized protein (TIGR02452 family)
MNISILVLILSIINFPNSSASILDETLHFINTHPLRDIAVEEIRPIDAQMKKEIDWQEQEIIKVLPVTSFQGAKKLAEEGYKPLILDMANATSPGGSVEFGKIAQEETLCLQSNLLLGLKKADSLGYYPIHEHGGILVKNVSFFRDDQFEFLSEPFIADVFAVSAYDCNLSHKEDLTKRLRGYDRPLNDEEYLFGTKAKMRAMFTSALENQNDSLVLSAFGCGAFQNDPHVIAMLFKDVLMEKAFKGKFKIILFAIPDKTGKNHQAFSETFR